MSTKIRDQFDRLIEQVEAMRTTRCTVVDKHRVVCTAEALDPGAEILICSRHAAMVVRLVRERAGV